MGDSPIVGGELMSTAVYIGEQTESWVMLEHLSILLRYRQVRAAALEKCHLREVVKLQHEIGELPCL